jgi:hypothetical protein
MWNNGDPSRFADPCTLAQVPLGAGLSFDLVLGELLDPVREMTAEDDGV